MQVIKYFYLLKEVLESLMYVDDFKIYFGFKTCLLLGVKTKFP